MKSFRFFLPRSNILNGSNQGFTRFDLSDEDVANSYTSLRPGAPNSAQPTTQLEMESGRMVNNGELCRSSDDEGPPEPVKFPTQQDVPNPDQITEWQAGWNVTNAIQGMFIVSFPYAVRHGGYWAIFAMIFIAYICCHTGKILVDCLYERNDAGQRVRVRSSYVEIAERVWGPGIGGTIVNLAQLIELLMTCILYLVLCGELMEGSFPDSPVNLRSWIMISTAFLLPCAFLQTLRHVSFLSFWNAVTHLLINAIIIIYCLTLVPQWEPKKVEFGIRLTYFPISLGIIVFSYTSQIFLPTLESNLVDRSKFRCMLYWSHISAAIFKAGFSYVGYVTFGESTKEVITNNLDSRPLKVIVNFALIIKSLLSYPLPYYASVKLLETALYQGPPTTRFSSCIEGGRLKVWALALRLAVVLFTLLMAVSIPHFAILMGLIGSLTGTMLSFIWPAYFHLHIKRHRIPIFIKCFDIFIIVIGCFCGLIGILCGIDALSKVMHGHSIDSHVPSFSHPLVKSNRTSFLWLG